MKTPTFNPKPANTYRVGDVSTRGTVITVDPFYEVGFVHIQTESGRWYRLTNSEMF